jgi:hypothetical protein
MESSSRYCELSAGRCEYIPVRLTSASMPRTPAESLTVPAMSLYSAYEGRI